ncbi:MAG: CoA protein activase [Clostridiaceae bacterium]|nr:CoA protein activase [Clostridiaceae bacterium]
MKVTFPHMGNLYISAKVLFEELGIDYVIPPFTSKKTLEIGTRYVPECACLPLKITIGNLIEAQQLGADTVLMAGGCGPCRFGYYCEMYREILKDLNCNMDIITLEPPGAHISRLLQGIRKLLGGCNLYKMARAVKCFTRVVMEVDEIERLVFKIKPRELDKGGTDEIYKAFKKDALKVKGARQIIELVRETKNKLMKVKTDEKAKPLKIGIVGEIYSTIDSWTNMDIQSRLGAMGVESHRYVTISNWVIEHIIKKALKIPRDLSYEHAARPYLGKMIGGHALETIGNTVLYALRGYDGIIQVYPLTCMPEIVAESILPAVERNYDIPVLTLIIDEMTGEAGYITRIEAFVDLILRKKEKKVLDLGYILPGY